jgi:hypothetical protein
MTRWEWAYILATISNNKSGIYLTYNK